MKLARVRVRTVVRVKRRATARAATRPGRVAAIVASKSASGMAISQYMAAIVAYWKEALTRSTLPTKVGLALNWASSGATSGTPAHSASPSRALSPAPRRIAHNSPRRRSSPSPAAA